MKSSSLPIRSRFTSRQHICLAEMSRLSERDKGDRGYVTRIDVRNFAVTRRRVDGALPVDVHLEQSPERLSRRTGNAVACCFYACTFRHSRERDCRVRARVFQVSIRSFPGNRSSLRIAQSPAMPLKSDFENRPKATTIARVLAANFDATFGSGPTRKSAV